MAVVGVASVGIGNLAFCPIASAFRQVHLPFIGTGEEGRALAVVYLASISIGCSSSISFS